MTDKYTPGPWVYCTGLISAIDGRVVDVIEDSQGLNIAEVFGCNLGDGELIAAAPELLQRLRQMVALWQRHGLNLPVSVPEYEVAVKLIKRLEGEK